MTTDLHPQFPSPRSTTYFRNASRRARTLPRFAGNFFRLAARGFRIPPAGHSNLIRNTFLARPTPEYNRPISSSNSRLDPNPSATASARVKSLKRAIISTCVTFTYPSPGTYARCPTRTRACPHSRTVCRFRPDLIHSINLRLNKSIP